jgi:hypothetical protein
LARRTALTSTNLALARAGHRRRNHVRRTYSRSPRTGVRCALECSPRLAPLFARSFPDLDIIAATAQTLEPQPDVAAHLPIGSLPQFFRTTRRALEATKSPYLRADPASTEHFLRKYHASHLRIDIAWHTSNLKRGRIRSIHPSLLKPLFSLTQIQWISLQYGDRAHLQQEVSSVQAEIVVDLAVDQLTNLDLFAAQIRAMDLVITIDNSTAHLAGALGLPVWLLLPFAADWRWLAEGSRSPWYPTMHLFRQPTAGDWPSVIENVREALSAKISSPTLHQAN